MPIKRILGRLKDQSGRTLVELLGVLVIIGVLSLGALYGFEYAMEANRENETLNRYAKVVAGARTSRILQNLGDYTKYDTQTGAQLPEFKPQVVNMNDVISNIGGDIITTSEESYILAPLKGSIKDGTEKQVEIYAFVETPEAFTVHADNLTYDACRKILAKDLGNDFVYEAQDGTQEWLASSSTKDNGIAKDLCEKVIGDPRNRGTLVMWFGPYECLSGDCVPPACKGAECCCETVGTKTVVKNPAPSGCNKPSGGTCVSCAEPDVENVCVPKAGYSSCEPSCAVGMCTGKNPYHCGKGLCCADEDDCGDGVCKGGTTAPVCKAPRPIVCGTQCCTETEECVEDRLGVKRCETRPTPGACGSTQTPCYDQDGWFTGCCAAYEVCNVWGECVSGGGGSCLPPRFRCGAADCCDQNQICKNGKCENKTAEQCPKDKPVPCPKAPNCCPKNQMCVNGKCKDKDEECEKECGKTGGVLYTDDKGIKKCCCSPGQVKS